MTQGEDKMENGNVRIEKPLVYTFKVIQNLENMSEIQPPRYRGKDKRPRKISVNSLGNLKPFQSVSDESVLRKYARDPYQKSGSVFKFLIALIILGLVILGYLIWKYYNEKREQS